MLKSKIAKSLGKVNNIFANFSSYLILILIILISSSVILRYIFSIGFTWLQDLYIWIHASIILFGIAYTLNKDGHVRIDIFYRSLSKTNQRKINFLGSVIFGLPICYFILTDGFEYFYRSLIISEDSKETGGLPNIFILKFIIFFMGILLTIEIVRQIMNFLSKK